MGFSSIEANSKAIAMVNTALQSGSIKLRGTQNDGETAHAESSAEVDAAYIARLLSKLSEGIQKLK